MEDGKKFQTSTMSSGYPLVSPLQRILSITDPCLIGEQQLKGKSLYFAKAIHDKAVSKQGSNDNEVMFGEVSGRNLNFIL
jgi:hypothetical protein